MPLNQTARQVLQRSLRTAELHAEHQAARLNAIVQEHARDIGELAKEIEENNKFIADLREQLKD